MTTQGARSWLTSGACLLFVLCATEAISGGVALGQPGELSRGELEVPPGETPDDNLSEAVSEPPAVETDVATEDTSDDDDSNDADSEGNTIRYFLEKIEVRGNTNTLASVVRNFIPLAHGDVVDVDDPELEAIRWRLLGTGWFNDVRLRIRRGTDRGWVVLVVEVTERNTIVIQGFTLGLAEDAKHNTDAKPVLEPYGGIAVAETNLLGLGMGLSAAMVLSSAQQGVRLRFSDPFFLDSPLMFNLGAFYNNARDFFGNDVTVDFSCPEDDRLVDCEPDQAVVYYDRYGFSVGSGHDFGASTRLTVDWQGEVVDVSAMPDAASERRGNETVPIDFAIDRDLSFVSTLQFGLTWDTRDDPTLPTRGTQLNFGADFSSVILGSDYEFLRLQLNWRQWLPMPKGHTLRVGVFGGVIFGSAPFFYKFYASDLSDLIPSRALELNLDRRPPPNLFGTAIGEMRAEELASRVDVEYGYRIVQRRGWFRALDVYANLGVYALADQRDIVAAIPGYSGASAIPIDLTFDVGLRADTDIGLIQFGFSNIIGFVSPFSE